MGLSCLIYVKTSRFGLASTQALTCNFIITCFLLQTADTPFEELPPHFAAALSGFLSSIHFSVLVPFTEILLVAIGTGSSTSSSNKASPARAKVKIKLSYSCHVYSVLSFILFKRNLSGRCSRKLALTASNTTEVSNFFASL